MCPYSDVPFQGVSNLNSSIAWSVCQTDVGGQWDGTHGVSASVGLGWGLKVGTSNMVPGDGGGLRATLGDPLVLEDNKDKLRL